MTLGHHGADRLISCPEASPGSLKNGERYVLCGVDFEVRYGLPLPSQSRFGSACYGLRRRTRAVIGLVWRLVRPSVRRGHLLRPGFCRLVGRLRLGGSGRRLWLGFRGRRVRRLVCVRRRLPFLLCVPTLSLRGRLVYFFWVPGLCVSRLVSIWLAAFLRRSLVPTAPVRRRILRLLLHPWLRACLRDGLIRSGRV